MNTLTNDTAPQWAVETAKEIHETEYPIEQIAAGLGDGRDVTAAIIARHAPQPTAPTAQPAAEPAATGTPDAGATPRTDETYHPPSYGLPDGHYSSQKETMGHGLLASPRTDAEIIRINAADLTAHDMLCEMIDFARQLERELAHGNELWTRCAEQHARDLGKIAGLQRELAESRAEAERLTKTLAAAHEIQANQSACIGDWMAYRDRAEAQLTARDGVIARLKEALDQVRAKSAPAGYDSGDSGIHAIADTALSLTPATYADALAKVEAETALANEKVSIFAEATRTIGAELTALRGLLETVIEQDLDSPIERNLFIENAETVLRKYRSRLATERKEERT